MKNLEELEVSIKGKFKKLKMELNDNPTEERKIIIGKKMNSYRWFFAYCKRERKSNNE